MVLNLFPRSSPKFVAKEAGFRWFRELALLAASSDRPSSSLIAFYDIIASNAKLRADSKKQAVY
jgi:hypothetical protein